MGSASFSTIRRGKNCKLVTLMLNYLLALCLYNEANSQTHHGMQLVYDVVVNRSNDTRGRWPTTLFGVVFQHKQFSSITKGYSLRINGVGDWLMWIQAQRIVARGRVSNYSINHYHTVKVKPRWSRGKRPVMRFKGHVFYGF